MLEMQKERKVLTKSTIFREGDAKMFGFVKWKYNRSPERVVEEHEALCKFARDIQFGQIKSINEAVEKAKRLNSDIAFGNQLKKEERP